MERIEKEMMQETHFVIVAASDPIRAVTVVYLAENGKSKDNQLHENVGKLLEKYLFSKKISRSRLDWHLERLCEENIITKERDCYGLTENGRKIYPLIKSSVQSFKQLECIQMTSYTSAPLTKIFE